MSGPTLLSSCRLSRTHTRATAHDKIPKPKAKVPPENLTQMKVELERLKVNKLQLKERIVVAQRRHENSSPSAAPCAQAFRVHCRAGSWPTGCGDVGSAPRCAREKGTVHGGPSWCAHQDSLGKPTLPGGAGSTSSSDR